ncbi:hydrolase [Pseudogemmobacter sp. W21_MBD1_M6]|uniref:hydrolase n=1 Tax=Pseudogemmobacter sp. W21_MBD1_M6 TaxID=3240271 RepID=UPI003F9C6DA9
MHINALPKYDTSINTTGCCPKFNPEGWDGQELRFRNKLFVKADTHSAFHIPLDMGRVFTRVQQHLEEAGAYDPADFIVLSHDLNAWHAGHYFSASKDIPNEEMVRISGDFITKVFEGPYKDAPDWEEAMKQEVRKRCEEPDDIFFFYTTCPRCAKVYGKNYVVGLAKVKPRQP